MTRSAKGKLTGTTRRTDAGEALDKQAHARAEKSARTILALGRRLERFIEGRLPGYGPMVRDFAAIMSKRVSSDIIARQGRLSAAFSDGPQFASPGHDGNKPELVEARDFAENHGKRDVTEVPQNNLNADRIKWLYEHRQIEQRQFDAAVRLQRLWEKSEILPSASSVMVGGGGGNQLPNDAKVDAMRHHGAAKSELGRDWTIVELVVHRQMTVEKAAGVLHVDRRVATGRLWSALHRLADHFEGGQHRERAKIRGGEARAVHPFQRGS